MAKMYEEVAHVEIPRNHFNRSKEHYFSLKVGDIVPVYTNLLLPNDLVKIKTQNVIRQQPTISPSFSNYVYTERAFVVAIRNLDPDIYRFMSGFKQYSTKTTYDEPMPVWRPSKPEKTKAGSLWDYMGYPINCIPDDKSLPMDYFRQAYNYIWDLYFRNQTIQESILDDNVPNSSKNEDILKINWDRDYFTTALPFQQLGDPIALPITGNANTIFDNQVAPKTQIAMPGGKPETSEKAIFNGINATLMYNSVESGSTITNRVGGGGGTPVGNSNVAFNMDNTNTLNDINGIPRPSLRDWLNTNTVDMSKVSSVLISDLRYAFALQLYGEMLSRGGIRDNEFLLMMYGTAPSDETLGRPYYLGGNKINVLTSEVLQTSQSTDTASLGELGGHGLGVGESGTYSYHAKELCILMIVGYIKPNTTYAQGMPKEHSLKTKYDFPLPVFSHLSEQPVYKREILCASTEKIKEDYTVAGVDNTAEAYNNTIWGYRPVYDWARDSTSKISGLLHREQVWTDANTIKEKTNLSNWTETRFFSVKDGERPALNNDFLQCSIDNRNYAITDQSIDSSQFLIASEYIVNQWRPLSLLGTPGRLDHVL